MGSRQLSGATAEVVAKKVFGGDECSREDVSDWYDEAEPQDRARLLQLFSSKIQDDFKTTNVRAVDGSTEFLYRIGTDSAARRRLRACAPLALSMLVSADLALGPGSRTLTNEDFQALVAQRMRTIIEEMFAVDDSIALADLYLFKREDAEAEGSIRVRHAIGSRTNYIGSEEKTERAARNEFRSYLKKLELYLAEHGTSINLEGHLDDKPVVFGNLAASLDSGSAARTARNLQRAYVIYSSNRNIGVSEAAGKSGSYEEFLREVVPALVKEMGSNLTLQHFMEGIDVDFLPSSRRGTVAHLFLIRSEAGATDADFERTVQRLLVRLCGFYAAATAVLEANRAQRQEALALRQSRDAMRERDKLRTASENLDKVSKDLQQTISSISELIIENFFLDRFETWLKDIQPLFDSNKQTDIPPTLPIRGGHTKWTEAHLGAALWLFARPNLAQLRGDFQVTPDKAWSQLHGQLDELQIKENDALTLLHRLKPNIDHFRRIRSDLIERCFGKFKTWFKNAEDRRRKDLAERTEFLLSEILFLMGEERFLDVMGEGAGDPAKGLLEESFIFSKTSMLEGLARLTHVIDSSVTDVFPAGGIARVDGAVIRAGAAGGSNVASVDSISFVANRKVEDPRNQWINPDVYEGWLHLRLQQTDAAIAAALKQGDSQSPGLDRSDIARAYRSLLTKVSEKLTRTDADVGHRTGEAGDLRGGALPPRRGGGRGGVQETSTALAKALGLLETYQGDVAGAEESSARSTIRAADLKTVILSPDASAGWPDNKQCVLRIMGARRSGELVAIATADLRDNCLEILIAPDA